MRPPPSSLIEPISESSPLWASDDMNTMVKAPTVMLSEVRPERSLCAQSSASAMRRVSAIMASHLRFVRRRGRRREQHAVALGDALDDLDLALVAGAGLDRHLLFALGRAALAHHPRQVRLARLGDQRLDGRR